MPPAARRSRRSVIGAGASVLMGGSRRGAGAATSAQDAPTPHRPPHAGSPSRDDTSSWFVISRPAEPGYITGADRFEVYDGGTFERLGGFQAVGTTNVAVTADPARILLATAMGASIFDLGTGNVRPVSWDVETAVNAVRLPDPRTATPKPPRWAFFQDMEYARALLVDLDSATGVDLAETLDWSGENVGHVSFRFSPDDRRAVVSVGDNGVYLLDPESPADARPLGGKRDDLISWAADFSPGSSRIAYVLRPPGDDAGPGTLMVEDLDSGDIVEIGPVDREGFAVFPPDSDDELIVFDDGTVTRREIDGGRELWRAETDAVVLGLGITGNTLFVGSARRADGTPAWRMIDLAGGNARRLPELQGLMYYNGSHANPRSSFQLMGPRADSTGDGGALGPLAAADLASGEVMTLLDEVDGTTLPLRYATSWDSGIILYAGLDEDSRYFLFDLASDERRAFTYDLPGLSPYHVAVSADGAAAGFTHWDNSGSGRMDVWLLDIAGKGEPEPLLEGRLWVWAGGPLTRATTNSRSTGALG